MGGKTITDHDFHRRLSAVADAATAEIDRYEQRLRRVRKELLAQELRAKIRRANAARVGQFRRADLLREAELIESVVRQIRKAMQ